MPTPAFPPTRPRFAAPAQGSGVGARLAALARAELATLQAHLAAARQGQDRDVHQARKSLQRLRAIVKLWAPLDPPRAERENLALRRMRRRLGPLRDAGARRETLRRLAARPRWSAHADVLRALAEREDAQHRGAWRRHAADSALWRATDRDLAGLAARVPQWPCGAAADSTLDAALATARRRLRGRWRDALGRTARDARHELRRKLRHYANLRRAAAQARGVEDPEATALLALAKRCGSEGDLWMARCSARQAPRHVPGSHALAQALQAERRARCAKHDEALRRALR